ncbi:glucan endo-1,6-beta-glucosidase [Mycena rebaudengoi]|nr:glucan endo-1,6-beta-glucosidase [Mycena rebaudengoi]
MRYTCTLLACLAIPRFVASQQISDIWETSRDQKHRFARIAPNKPIRFGTSGDNGDANIIVSDNKKFQTIDGFGGSLSDSSALVLNNLKGAHSENYWDILRHLFSMSDGGDDAGLSYLRVPIGASDFSDKVYSLDDSDGDTSFRHFNIDNAPSYLFSVLKDILSVNNDLKVHIVPWSPPGWMKTTGKMNGGAIKDNYVDAYPTYLLKAVQGFKSHGIRIYAISVQNEPKNTNPSYPTCTMSPSVEGRIGAKLRKLLNGQGFSKVKLVGYEHNWNNAGDYPVELMQDDGESYNGVAFHCYSGNVGNQDMFHSAFPDKAIYFTECTGTIGSDWWSDIKWYMDNLWIGSLEHYAQVGLMFNIALNEDGLPKLPGTNSCGSGCRPIVTVHKDGSYEYNQEFYSMAQASRAIIPKDANGPWGKRIGVSVKGNLGWALRVGAYSTARNDGAKNGGKPGEVRATIEFRGVKVSYTFPVGVTTLSWFTPGHSKSSRSFNTTSPSIRPAFKPRRQLRQRIVAH